MIAPKPHGVPKPHALERSRTMTIAIGIRSNDGIVLAADRQNTWGGGQKTDEGKVRFSWRADPYSGFALTGAGAGANLDAVGNKMADWFLATEERREKEFANQIEQLHCDFYQQKVMPFAATDIQRVDYGLIIGHSGKDSFARLWWTEGLTINTEQTYAAVGIGAAFANSLLSKLWMPLPTTEVITLAAFVINEVKGSVEGCGLGTDIIAISRGRPWTVTREDIEEMEKAFKLFRYGERNHFHKCMGHDMSKSPFLQQVTEKYKDYETQISTTITRLASQRLGGQP
jgi:20S proteasome alpha/beta subunit